MWWHPAECRTCESTDEDGRVCGVELEAESACPRCREVFPRPGECYRCGEPRTPRTLERVLGAPPRPLLSPFEAEIEAALGELGRDADGRALVSEQRALLDEYGIHEPHHRDLVRRLWSVSLSEAAHQRALRIETRKPTPE